MEDRSKINHTFSCLMIMSIILMSTSESITQDFKLIDTIYSSEDQLMVRCHGFVNHLTSEEIVTFDYDPFSSHAQTQEEKFYPFLITYLPKKEKFTVLLYGIPIYHGEGDWRAPTHGKHTLDAWGTFMEGHFVDGKLEGELKIISKDRGSEITRDYKNGELEGAILSKNKDGLIDYFCAYENGLKNGLEFKLHDDGMLSSYYYYKNGFPIDGVYFHFDGDGIPVEKITIKNGKVKKVYLDDD
jgi:hypothetical protein